MFPQRLIIHFSDLNVWYSDGQRRSQKPLVLVLALARVQAGKPRMIAFDEIEEKLQQVIEDFDPPDLPLSRKEHEKAPHCTGLPFLMLPILFKWTPSHRHAC
jgi:hypothetical protein